MNFQTTYRPLSVADTTGGAALDFDFTMAFQPIVNTTTKSIFAHEALARGLDNEPVAKVFEHVNQGNRYRFDQVCRTKAIKLAAQVGVPHEFSINFMPNAVYRPDLGLQISFEAAETFGFPIDRIIFEITEAEKVDDQKHLCEIIQYYREKGFKTAIDDFGAGYAGLNFLADMQTDIIKLDMTLIRNIDQRKSRQAIVKGVLQVRRELAIEVIAEGIETYEELRVLQDFGVELFQGYYFARPAFESLAEISPAAFERR